MHISGKNILVTGGSGFIGSHLVDELIEKGHHVQILDLKVPYSKKAVFIEGSILDLDVVKKATLDMDVIYHFSGVSNIDKVKDDPLETIQLNILGTANLLEQARKQKVNRFFF